MKLNVDFSALQACADQMMGSCRAMPYAKFRISGLSGEETRTRIVYSLAEFDAVKRQLELEGYRHFNGICSVMSYEIA